MGQVLKFIHAADFHLDSPFAGLAPEQAQRRRGEQRALLDALAALARERQADAVLLAGDLLDSEWCYRETAQALSRALGAVPCPVFIAPGNHDFCSPRSVYAALDWPENVHIFRSAGVEGVELPGKNCVVHGAAFPAPRMERSPLSGFRAEQDGRTHVMVLHGDTAPQGAYGPITPRDIADSGLAYLALGHVHQYSGLQRAGDTFWAYPGCPEGRGFDELGDKGVLYVELEEGACRAEFVPLCTRRYQILTVPLAAGDEPLSAVRAALPGDTARDICRVILTGEQDTPPDLAALERALSPGFFALTLRDATRPPRELWARAGEDTLTGLFLQEMARRMEDEPDSEQLRLALRFGMAALEGGEDAAP